MTKEELEKTLERLRAEYKGKYGKDFSISAQGPIDGTLFGYALDIQRCIGCRRCVYACVAENNQTRDPQMHYIRVLRFKNASMDLEESTIYYDPDEVPEKGYYYMPVQCQHCANPPCTKVCPVKATWTEPDGIVVVDYNWCIGCRCAVAACPYMGRWFNFTDPEIPGKRSILPPTTWGTGPDSETWWKSAHSAFKGSVWVSIRLVSRFARWGPASSATSWTPTARYEESWPPRGSFDLKTT